ncbi:MAG: hypothetical protein AAGK78_08900 [Planctomycetota bacterium]
MKNAGKHAQTLKALAKKWSKTKAGDRPEEAPVRAAVLAVLRRDTPDATVDQALSLLEGEYADFNELRVATELELHDLLGGLYKDIDERAGELIDVLMGIFDTRGRLHLDDVAEMNRREQRPALKAIAGLSPYVESYIALCSFGIGTIPIDESGMAYLIDIDVLEDDVDAAEAHKFVESNLKADECWPFFVKLREETIGKPKRAKTTAKKTTKKTAKKTAKK